MKCKICGAKVENWYSGLFDDRHGYPGKFDVLKCKRCGFGQSSPQLTENKIAKIYSRYYPWNKIEISKIKKSDFSIPNKLFIWRKGLSINGQYNVLSNSKVLDVGCGLGHSLLELESIGCKAYGIDPDKNALKMAKKFKLNIKIGFVEDNLYPKEKFDFIIGNQVLEHTNNPINFIKVLKSKLNNNGQIILSFPNVNSITRILLGQNWLHWHMPYHLNFFTTNSLKMMAHKNNLKIIKLNTITPNMWTNLQIRRLLQKPTIGQRDLFWDGKLNKNEVYNTGLFPKVIHFFEEYNFINRIIDMLGLGESYILILSKA